MKTKNTSFSVVVSPSGVIYYLNLIGDCKLKEHNTSLLDFDIICRSDKCIIHTEESLYPVDSVKCCSVRSSHLIGNKCSQMSVQSSFLFRVRDGCFVQRSLLSRNTERI